MKMLKLTALMLSGCDKFDKHLRQVDFILFGQNN